MRTISLSLFMCLTVCISVGRGKSPEKIKGGTVTQDGDFPFMVALLYKKQFICGGSIIDETHVLTAVHCVVSHDLSYFTNILVRIGSNDLLNTTADQVLKIKIINVYKGQTTSKRFENDIAILTLKSSIQFSRYVQSIALPDPMMHIPFDAYVTAVGWGPPSPSESPRFQRRIKMRLIHIESCIHMWGEVTINHLRQLCTMGDENESPTGGDSGGPLLYKNQIIGIVASGGSDAPIRTFPHIFTRIVHYHKWITEIMKRY